MFIHMKTRILVWTVWNCLLLGQKRLTIGNFMWFHLLHWMDSRVLQSWGNLSWKIHTLKGYKHSISSQSSDYVLRILSVWPIFSISPILLSWRQNNICDGYLDQVSPTFTQTFKNGKCHFYLKEYFLKEYFWKKHFKSLWLISANESMSSLMVLGRVEKALILYSGFYSWMTINELASVTPNFFTFKWFKNES